MQWSRGWARHWDREFCGVPVQANGLKKKPVRCDFRCDAWVRIADMCFSWGFLSGTVSIACFVFGDASPQRGDVEIQLNHGSRAQEPLSDSSIYPGLKTYNPILNPHILSHLSQDALCIRSCQEVCPIKHGRARFYIYYIYIYYSILTRSLPARHVALPTASTCMVGADFILSRVGLSPILLDHK